MRIGSIVIKDEPALALAPMAGYTDTAYRELVALRGADIVYTELVSATAIARQGITFDEGKKQTKTSQIMRIGKAGLSGIQLFGSKCDDIAIAVKAIAAEVETGACNAKFIDINFGCPAKKVVKNGSGSKLLESPKKMAEIAQAAIKASDLPVTSKIRLGFKAKNSLEIVRALEGAGISAIAVHARTAEQKFGGSADWGSIREIVQEVEIPIIGNGDVKTPKDVRRICDVSGCAGVMAGRAVLADPDFFLRAREYLISGKASEPVFEEKTQFLREYIELSKKYGIEFNLAKSHSLQLISGFRGAARMRGAITKCKTEDELLIALSSPDE